MEACMEGHFSSATSVQFINLATDTDNSDYNYAMSTSRDKVLIVWDLKTFAKVKTIPVYESVESCLMLSRLFSATRDFDGYTLTMGNDGLIKLWDLQNSKMMLAQSELDSPKIVNRSNEGASSLEQCFIQSVFVKSKNMLCLVTIDQLIIFVQLDPDQLGGFIKGEQKKDSEHELFQTSKQFIGDHGEILDAQLLNANANLLALATNSEFIKIYDLDTWNCMLLKGHKDLVIGLR